MKSFKQLGINGVTNKLVGDLEYFHKLKEIANRKNYYYRTKQLHVRIQEEYDLWNKKEPSQRLLDLKKDLTFIESQLNESNLNKERIDILVQKYGLS